MQFKDHFDSLKKIKKSICPEKQQPSTIKTEASALLEIIVTNFFGSMISFRGIRIELCARLYWPRCKSRCTPCLNQNRQAIPQLDILRDFLLAEAILS